jgi:hypothetical protein
MAGFQYVGALPVGGTDVINKVNTDQQIQSAPVSQGAVQSQITTAIAALASQTSVGTALNAFVVPGYLATQDALLLPNASVGVPSGVASLNSSGVIPTPQVPVLGASYILGPFGPTATFNASATSVPIKIADWNIGPTGVTFFPQVWMTLFSKAVNLGRAVVEVWMSNAQMTYGQGVLLSRGVARSFWNDYSPVVVQPVPFSTGLTPGTAGMSFSPTYPVWMTAWLFDANDQGVTVASNNIASAGAWFTRLKT